MRYSVVIASWNARDVLADCIDSVLAQDLDGPLETIVVDNASTDGTDELLLRYGGDVCVIRNQENMGYSAGINQGARAASGDVLFLVNSDTQLRGPTVLQRLADALSMAGVGLVGPRYVTSDGTLQPGCSNHPSVRGAVVLASGLHHVLPDRLRARLAPSEWSHDYSRTVDCVMGAVLGVRAEVFRTVGGFWPLMYASEEDLAWKVQRRGLSVRFVREAEVLHVGNHSNRRRWSDAERAARVGRSELAFLSQHYSRARALAIRAVAGIGFAVRALALWVAGRRRRAEIYAALAAVYASRAEPPGRREAG